MSNEKWYCPECGAQNSGNFCTVCGAMRKKDESFTCACGNVFTGNFCPECGSPRQTMQLQFNKAGRSLTDEDKKKLVEHGWRDDKNMYRFVLKDGIFTSCYTPVVSDGSEGETLQIDTDYKFSLQELGNTGMAFAMLKLEHPDEEFVIYPRDPFYRSEGRNICNISKLWYGSGTLHADLMNCNVHGQYTVDLVLDDTVSIAPSEPAPAIGWTCSKCGKENQTGEFCEECGEAIKKVVLFSCSSYHSTNPPRYEGVTVYEFSDTELICMFYTNGESRSRYISKDVIDPALNIIKEYGINKWKDYENTNTYLMGGSVSVMYRDGDELVGSSLEHMGFAVSGAYSKLMALFNNA